MRASGILMPVSSLPSGYGIGCFSKEAYAFADALAEAGQRYWQILPLGPTGYGDSPYQPFSAFAGNPYFIDPETLVEEGLLEKEEADAVFWGDDPSRIDYALLYRERYKLLRKAFLRSDMEKDPDYLTFCEQEKGWLRDYCLFMALKKHFDGKPWFLWEDEIRLRKPEALKRYGEICREEIHFQAFMQYLFMKQWKKLKEYVNALGIRIIGDIPIYVAMDGADAWSDPSLFEFDENRMPGRVAGCPPDAFAADGQLWGNPLYDWAFHEKTGYRWWIERIQRCMALYDVIRVDHFRGFDEYYAIPYGSKTAAGGSWEPGPGMKLFHALAERLGSLTIIAEDLGYLTESVMRLVEESGFPGMKVMEFAFDSREAGDYFPYHYTRNCVAYTGTHDNQTLKAWYYELNEKDRAFLDEYLDLYGKDIDEIVWAVIRLTMNTVADTVIIPMQDYLCLGGEARINKPSTLGNNWIWRMQKGQFTEALRERIRRITEVYGRI